jgi:hypothetical protein
VTSPALLRCAWVLTLSACLRATPLVAQLAVLEVDSVPSEISQRHLNTDGTYLLTGRIIEQQPEWTTVVRVFDGAVDIGTASVVGDGEFSIPWQVPQGVAREPHTLVFRARDERDRSLSGERELKVVVWTAPPKITAFAVGPVWDAAGAVDVTWQSDEDSAYAEVSFAGEIQLLADPSARQLRLTGLPVGVVGSVTLSAVLANGNRSESVSETIGAGVVLVQQNAPLDSLKLGTPKDPIPTITQALALTRLASTPFIIRAGPGTYAASETFPLVLGPGQSLEGTRGPSGAWLTEIAGAAVWVQNNRDAEGNVAPVNGCSSLLLAADDRTGEAAPDWPTEVRDLKMTGGSTACGSQRSAGVASALLASVIERVSIDGAQLGVQLFGRRYAHQPTIKSSRISAEYQPVFVNGSVFPALSDLDLHCDNQNDSSGVFLFNQDAIAADFADASRISSVLGAVVTGCSAGLVTGGAQAVLIGASSTRRSHFTLFSASSNAIAAQTFLGKSPSLTVCGCDIDYQPGSSDTFSANNTAIAFSSDGSLSLGETSDTHALRADCDRDPRVTLTTSVANAGGLSVAGDASVRISHTRFLRTSTAQPAMAAQRFSGVVLGSCAQCAVAPCESYIHGSQIAGYHIGLRMTRVPTEPCLARRLVVQDVCLSPLSMPAVQATDALGFAPSGSLSWTELSATDASLSPINFATNNAPGAAPFLDEISVRTQSPALSMCAP